MEVSSCAPEERRVFATLEVIAEIYHGGQENNNLDRIRQMILAPTLSGFRSPACETIAGT